MISADVRPDAGPAMSASHRATVCRIRLRLCDASAVVGNLVDADETPRRWAAIAATGISAYASIAPSRPKRLY
ncbi:MAG: hypothetical protein QOJ56_3148 [Mycobacterium sp.]|nr:hypothetical protein [Mycobacterium sp.]